MVGKSEFFACIAIRFGKRKHRREDRHCRVREQTIDTIGRNRKLCVVVIVGVDENAVGQSRKPRGDFHSGSDDAGLGTRCGEFFHILANERPHWRDRARKSQTEAVEHGFSSQRQHVFRNVFIFGVGDEVANVLRQPGYVRKLTRTFLWLR